MAPNPAKLIIFDFDGTLFDTHASIAHCIHLTFTTLLPTTQPSPDPSLIQSLISSGAGLQDTFRSLHQSLATPTTTSPPAPAFDEPLYTSTYRSLYATHGQPLISPFPGAGTLLSSLRSLHIPIAIISNKGVDAVTAALARNGLDGLVPPQLIVGDRTPGATRKPDPGSFANVLVPRLEGEFGMSGLREEEGGVLVVGDTTADLRFARNIGAKSVWCRFGYGDRAACEAEGPDWVVDGLEEVLRIAREEAE